MDDVLNWLWQGLVVAVACLVMLRLLERARANVRYVVCWAALLLVAVLPALPSVPSTGALSDTISATSRHAIVALPDTWWTSSLLMLAVWAAWATVSTIRFASAMVALRRARTRSRAFPSQVESALPHWSRVRHAGRRAALVLSDSVSTAAVLGGGSPMIAVAPSLLTTLDAGELDRVLIHEWAHVQRRDDFGHLLQIAIGTLAGWHPAVWWIGRRLDIEREVACDEITVAITGSPKTYAKCLMTLANLRGGAPPMHAAPAVLTMSSLRARVTRILSPHPWIAPAWARAIAVAIVSTLCALSAGIGCLNLVEATTLARPFESMASAILSPPLKTIAPAQAPTPSDPAKKERPRRQPPVSAPSTQRPAGKEAVIPPTPERESNSPSTSVTARAVETAPAAEPDDGQAVSSEPSSVAQATGPQPSDVKTEQPRSPWSAAADSGVAIGHKSKQAGVATAGFFTRVARRVAGSF